MTPVLVSVLAGLGAGFVVLAATRVWGSADPGAPRVEGATVGRHIRLVRSVRSRVDPALAAGSALVLVAAVTIVGGGAVGVVLEMVRAKRGFAAFDASATQFGAAHATAASTQVLRIITQFGGAVVIVPIAVVVGVLEARRLRSWATVGFLAVVVGGQFAVADIIKALVGRARPDVLRLTGFAGPSFPSGHATAAAAVYAAFALLFGRGRSRRVKSWSVAAAVGVAVMIATTRVMLGVHWLTDIVAGLCLGWTWFALCSLAFGGRRLRLGAPLDAMVTGPAAAVDRPAGATPAARLDNSTGGNL